MDNLSKWNLKSLTIGPQVHETSAEFWEEAFGGLPPLHNVGNVTIIYTYPTAKAFTVDCWKYFDRLLTRQDLFPALDWVDIQSNLRSQQLGPKRWLDITTSLPAIRTKGLWPRRKVPDGYMSRILAGARSFVSGQGKFLVFKRDHKNDPSYKKHSSNKASPANARD